MATPYTVYRYRFTCTTEGKTVYTWAKEPPTTCPNNSGHVIDTNSLEVITQVAAPAVPPPTARNSSSGK